MGAASVELIQHIEIADSGSRMPNSRQKFCKFVPAHLLVVEECCFALMQLRAKRGRVEETEAREVVGSAKPQSAISNLLGSNWKQAQIDNACVLCKEAPMGYEAA